MTILDHPIETELAPVKRHRSWFEIVLVMILLSFTIALEITGSLWLDSVIMISGTFLGLGYLFAYNWIEKPYERTFRTTAIAILYGITLWMATNAFIFSFLFLSGAEEIRIATLSFCAISLIVDLVTSINKVRLTNLNTFIRIGVLGAILHIKDKTILRVTN